ncbi:unnamed protein product [Prorocentrum cordatum]|uniref:peptide-methionine (S)-S-oxide reductase n=1 Tax=Prorocentrum cordatum TaxID=2364126 RepID=A0ABN9SQY4_9DINO|nr:unnamed protein product [Polarella glacialis]
MAVMMLILLVVSVLGGVAASACAYKRTVGVVDALSVPARPCASAGGAVLLGGGLLGALWCLLSPPPFSARIDGPPEHRLNDPGRSIYLGNGCFWHTQYDVVMVEQGSAFGNRTDGEVTALVGYAGGLYESQSGSVCYHGLPHTDYGRLGHAEAVSVTIDAASGADASAQISALAEAYFEHGFQTVDGRRQRLDPQDMGAEYRNVIGLPGGMDNIEWWPLFQAANIYSMPLIRANGGSTGDDTEDEYVVYVYDSLVYPFFRGEAYHQFHENSVIGRPLPASYLSTLKTVQADIGRLGDDDIGCAGVPAELIMVFALFFGLSLGLGCILLDLSLPPKYRLLGPEGLCCRALDTSDGRRPRRPQGP